MGGSIVTRMCRVLAGILILGVGSVAEADFVIFMTDGRRTREIEVEEFSDTGDYIQYPFMTGVSVKVPKSHVLGILDRATGDLQLPNPDLFTPEQVKRLQGLSETYRRGLEAARKAEEEARKAEEARRNEQEEIDRQRLLKAQEAIQKAEAEERMRGEALGAQLRAEAKRVFACAWREAGDYRQFERLSPVDQIILIKSCRRKLFPN